MKSKFFFISVLIISILGFSGCNKDDDDIDDGPCSTNWALAVQDEANAWSSAATAYGTNPTAENCNAYKQAGNDYLDALEPFDNCAVLTGQQRAEWQAAIDAARESINNLNCN